MTRKENDHPLVCEIEVHHKIYLQNCRLKAKLMYRIRQVFTSFAFHRTTAYELISELPFYYVGYKVLCLYVFICYVGLLVNHAENRMSTRRFLVLLSNSRTLVAANCFIQYYNKQLLDILQGGFQRQMSYDRVRRIVQEEGRTARNLITWSVPVEGLSSNCYQNSFIYRISEVWY